MTSGIVIHGIGCTLFLLLVLFAQAIDYEVYRHDVMSAKLTTDDIVLTSRDFLEQLHFLTPKASHTLQERTEHLLHFGALLRMRVLEIFGSLLYIYYDNFSVAEVESLHKVYREIFERRHNIFSLIPGIPKKQALKPSEICDEIYAHAKSCLRSSATVCSRIKKHDLPDLNDLETPSGLNVTLLVYRLSKLSKQYHRGFSLEALLKLLQRGVLTITPGLLSGLLYHVRYENFDDDVRLAERELARHFHEFVQTTDSSPRIILKQLTTKELKRFHSVNSFFRYYINIYIEKILDENLKRYAFLIAKRIADIGTIDENIQFLGNVYEDRTIHIKYLFDLVLSDDVLDKDVIDAKRYLVKKLEKLNVVEKYLRVYKYQQLTPAQLTLEITGQLRDIDFAKSIAISLHIHAKYWRSGHMIETLHELLELFDAYENLRDVPDYQDMMSKIDQIKKSLWTMKDVPVEILCNAPRGCLQIGLQSVLRCKLVSSEIKALIRDFFNLSDMCVDHNIKVESEIRRYLVKDIPVTFSKVKLTTKVMEMNTTATMPTTPLSTSETSTETATTVSEIVEEPETTAEFVSISTTTPMTTAVEFTVPETATTTVKTETSTITTELPTTITTESPTTTIKTSTTITTELPTITTTELPPTSTELLTTTTTKLPTTATTELPTTTTTESPTTTTTESLTTTTTESPTTTTTESPTIITTESSTTITKSVTTTTESPTTTTESPTTTTESPTTTTESSTTTTESPTTTTESPTTTTESPTTTTESPRTTITVSPTTTLLATFTKLTSATSATILPITTEEIPTIELKLARSKVERTSESIEDTSITLSTPPSSRECESNECEVSSEETSEIVTNLPTTPMPTTKISIPFKIFKTYRKINKIIPEATTATSYTTESYEIPTTTGDECVTKSCSEECRSETVESSTRSCEASCDSEEDCDEEGSVEDVSEKMENHTIECHEQCEQESPEISSGCEKDKSCECASSKDERSAECVTVCRSEDSSSCEDDQDNCSIPEMPMIDIKLERKQQRALCEIRDSYHRRQKSRLAKMRAISAVASRVDVLRSRTSRRRPRIMTKKLYNLLAAELPRSKDKESERITEYLLKQSVAGLNQIKGGGRKRRKQRKEEIYRLKKKMARKLRNKRLNDGTYSQLERIPEKNVMILKKH